MFSTDEPISAADGKNHTDNPIFDAVFGSRARDYEDFSASMVGAEDVAESRVREIYSTCGGRRRIGAQIVETSLALDVRFSDVDSSQLGALARSLPAASTDWPTINVAAIGLLELLSVFPDVDGTTLTLAHTALPLYLNVDPEDLPIEDDLVSQLVFAQLLTIAPHKPRSYSIPALIGSLMERGTALPISRPGAARVALRKTLERTHRVAVGSAQGDLSAILGAARFLESWQVLEEIWSSNYVNVFVSHMRPAIDSYLSLPANVLHEHPILADAHDFAGQADHLIRTMRTEDPMAIVPRLVSEPPVEQRSVHPVDNVGIGARSADEVAIMHLRAARREESRDTMSQSLRARHETLGLMPGSKQPSPVLSAEVDYEHALRLGRAGRFAESLDLLHKCIRATEARASDLPFPLQNAHATAAQTYLLLGLHHEADHHLAQVRSLELSSGMISESVRYAVTTTELYRRLDELDLESSSKLLAEAKTTRRAAESAAALFLAEGLYEVYSGRASLAVKNLIEVHTQRPPWTQEPTLMRDSSRLNILSFVCLAAGEKKPVQHLLTELKPTTPGFALAKVRLYVALGQAEEALRMIPRVLDGDAGPRIKACGYALRAVCMLMLHRSEEAVQAFVTALEYSAVSSTLMAIAQLPRGYRQHLVKETEDEPAWKDIALSLGNSDLEPHTLQHRVSDLPETLKTVPIETQTEALSTQQLALLFALESGHSIARIAHDTGMVEGTVKNKLSGLYKRLGVRNRNQAIAYGRDHGYFSTRG